MTQQDHLRWRAGDTILILVVVLVAALLLLGLFVLPGQGDRVQVTVDGQVIATFPLSGETTYVIPGVEGTNTLVIKDGAAMVRVADCPDEICVRHQAISLVGQSILCLPHKVAVTVIGGEPAVDAEV